MNAVGWPNVKHIDPHSKEGGLSEIIGQAQSMKGFTQVRACARLVRVVMHLSSVCVDVY